MVLRRTLPALGGRHPSSAGAVGAVVQSCLPLRVVSCNHMQSPICHVADLQLPPHIPDQCAHELLMGMYTTFGQCFIGPSIITSAALYSSSHSTQPLRVVLCYIECSTEMAKLDTILRDMWPSLELIETAAELSDGVHPSAEQIRAAGPGAVSSLHHPPKVLQLHCGF